MNVFLIVLKGRGNSMDKKTDLLSARAGQPKTS